MTKVFIKRLYPYHHLWSTYDGMDEVRMKLNRMGFYVLHGPTLDCLDVYAIKYTKNELEYL